MKRTNGTAFQQVQREDRQWPSIEESCSMDSEDEDRYKRQTERQDFRQRLVQ